MSEPIMRRADATKGDRGELLLAAGERVGLRVWEGEPSGEEAPRHSNPYEFVAYVTAGRLRVSVGDADPEEVGPGDSWVVSAGTEYGFEVLEQATVVEGVSPPT